MKNTLTVLLVVLSLQACYQPTTNDISFDRFVNRFQLIDLPLDTSLLYRVHNSDIVSGRIDTTLIQQFIDKNYKLRVNQSVYDGYGYGVRLPHGDSTLYEGLIYYSSKGYQQFFILNTYTPEGELVNSLPISGDKNGRKRTTVQISAQRIIVLRESILHYPDSGATEYLYQIDPDGTIVPLDTFFEQ